MKLTSIITINYNQSVVTVDFLNSVKRFADNNYIELILVDNAPSEDYRNQFVNAFPPVKYIKSEKNLGYAGGNNLGISMAEGEYILLLNNDTEITDGFITSMINELERNNEIGLLSPLIKYFENPTIIQYAGFTPMNYFTCRNSGIGNMEKDMGQYDNESRETSFCHGAALMCRKSDLERVGLMDESYFLYYEELDWSEKFKKIGKKIWFTGKAKIYHKESISVGKMSITKTFFNSRNRYLFIRRNASFYEIVFFSMYYIFLATPVKLSEYAIAGKFDLMKAHLNGIYWNLTHSKNSRHLGFKIS